MKSLSNQGAKKEIPPWECRIPMGKNPKPVNVAGAGFLGNHIKLSTCAGELVENYISTTGKS